MTGGYIMKEMNIRELAKRMGLITVENMCQYTIAQLVVMVANKVNELVNEVWRFETDVQEILKTQNENIQYLLGEGLHLEVENIFDGWLQDGTFDTLINQSALKKVNDRIDETNARLSQLHINVLDHGVKVNSDEPQQDNINTVLNEFKGHTIFFPDGNYLIDSSIIVHSNTKLVFSNNSRVVFKAGRLANGSEFNANTWKAHHMIKNDLEDGLENITIVGAKLYGNGYSQHNSAVHKGFYFQNIKNLTLDTIECHEISGWNICYINIENFHFKNIIIDSCRESIKGYNGDGISGIGRNGIIENVIGYSSDDLVSIHSGEDIMDVNAGSENIEIRNVTAIAKEGELTHRIFSIYDNGSSFTRNIRLKGVYGACKQKVRITNFSRSDGNGVFENITLEDMNLDKNTLLIDKATIDRLKLINVTIRNLTRYDYESFVEITEPSSVNELVLDNCAGYIVKGTPNAMIVDSGGISNLTLSDCNFTGTDGELNYVYYRNSVVPTTETQIYATNISGNVKHLAGRISSSTATIKLKRNINEYNGRMTYEQGVLVYDSQVGEKFYHNGRNEFIPLTSLQEKTSTLYVNDSTVTIDRAYTLIMFNTANSTLNIVPDNIPQGAMILIGATIDNSQIHVSENGTPLFGGNTLDKGTHMIVRLATSWVRVKLSDDFFKSTL